MTEAVRVGLVGAGYIAGVHSAAYRALSGTFPDLGPIELARVADVDRERADRLSAAWGWRQVHEDWRQVVAAPDVDVVDVAVPNLLHAEIAIEALERKKHVLCEKPLASRPEAAREMVTAADLHRRHGGVCLFYRTWPAITLARDLLASGDLGQPRHFRGWVLQDYARDPGQAMGWRIDPAQAGAGALGDLGTHIIDMARFLVGEIVSVCALTSAYVSRAESVSDADDLACLLVRFAGDCSGVLEAGWAMTGHRCDLGFDLVCEHGALRFGWERSNELGVYRSGSNAGYERVPVGPAQRDVGAFIAVPMQGLGYRDAFTLGIATFLRGIRDGSKAYPTFADGLRAAEVVAGAQESARTGGWVNTEPPGNAAVS